MGELDSGGSVADDHAGSNVNGYGCTRWLGVLYPNDTVDDEVPASGELDASLRELRCWRFGVCGNAVADWLWP